MAITTQLTTEIVLLFGSLVALVVGIVGRRVKSNEQQFKTTVRLVSGLTGLLMLVWTLLMASDGGYDILWYLVFLLLGVGLLFPLLPKVNLGTIFALIIAAIVAFAVSSLEIWWVIIIFLIVFFILWFVLGILFRAVRGVGAVLGSRIVLLVVGVIGLVMAVYYMVM